MKFATTINAAEFVILAIAEAEVIDPMAVTFFDLLTCHGYRHIREGEHEFMQLMLGRRDGHIEVTEWRRCACPPDILRSFGVVS